MKIQLKDLPIKMEAPGMAIRAQNAGNMAIAYLELPAGTDFTPLLKGLNNDSCHAAHWGYIIEGKIRIIYDDGTEEVTSAGEVYYWPAGHTGVVEEDLKMIELSPEQAYKEVTTHIFSMMEA